MSSSFKRLKLKIFILATAFSFTFSQITYAGGIQSSIESVYKKLGGEVVSTRPNAYKGQKAGHFTGGSMYFSKAKKNRTLISVNMPEINLDKSCYNQGVLNFGGMSFISGEELINKLKNIGQQAGMMFVYLGMSSISPVIGETLQEVYSKLQEVGGFLSDECQTAKQIVSFMGDKMSQHSEVAKSLVAKYDMNNGNKKDLSDSYKNFHKNKSDTLDKAGAKDERLILENINIAWNAISKLKIQDKELKKLMMTISGTVIIRANKDNTPSFQYISSGISSSSLLEGLLAGGANVPILDCSDDKCLSVSESDRYIKDSDSFQYKVLDYFGKIKEAIIDDKELDIGSQNFLSQAGLPIYAINEVLINYTNNNPEYEQGLFVEVVAWNILYNYLSGMLREINEATNNLQISANSELKEFKDQIRATQKLLESNEERDLSRYKLQLNLVNRAEKMEDAVSEEMSQILNMSKGTRL